MEIASAKAKSQFSEMLHRAQYGRECFVITVYGKPVARLIPIGDDVDPAPAPRVASAGIAVSSPTAGVDE